MQQNKVTVLATIFLAIATLITVAAIAPAKSGYIRKIDQFKIERSYTNTINDYKGFDKTVSVSTKPNEDGELDSEFTARGSKFTLGVLPFINPEYSAPTLSSTSKADGNNKMSLVMMHMETTQNNMIFSLTGDHAMNLVGQNISNKEYALANSCITIKKNTIRDGQRSIEAEINCALSLTDIVAIVTNNDELATKQTALSEAYFLSVGSYQDLWKKFGQEQEKSVKSSGLAFTPGSNLYISFVNKKSALDKGINFLYKARKDS